MRISLEFVDIAELRQFADWASARGGKFEQVVCGELSHTVDTRTLTDPRGQDTRPITAEGAVTPNDPASEPQGAQDTQEPAGAGEPPSADPAPEAAPKRKRRTKAQIAADEAAAKASNTNEPAATPVASPLDNLKPETPAAETVTTELHPDVLALAATIDGTDSLSHMNEARGFIASQGFPAYSETFKLTGLPSAIAGYTPEQVALHRAVMQWLTAQAGAK